MAIDNFWQELSERDQYVNWQGGWIYGFFFEKGLYDHSPIADFINKKFSKRTLHKHLNIATTNVLNGKCRSSPLTPRFAFAR